MNLAQSACLVFSLSTTQLVIAQGPIENDRHADTRRLIELTGVSQVANQLMDAEEGRLPPEGRNEFRKLREAGFFEAMLDQLVPIFEKYFTAEEVKALIAFQESPLGSKLRSLQPQMMKDGAVAAQRAMMDVMQRVQRTEFERQAAYYKAVELAEKGQLEAAITAFRDAIKSYPNTADLHYGLGDVFHDAGQDQEALASYVKATQFNAHTASTHPKLNAALRAADAKWHDGCGVTALMLAATVGDAVATRALLAKSADASARNNFGFTPVSTASFWGHTDVVEVLLAAGGDVESRGTDGATALMQAAAWGHEQVVRALLKAGADVNAKDNDGRTAMDVAVSRGYTKIVELLKEAAQKAQQGTQRKT